MSWTGVRTIMVLELRQRVRATRWQLMLGIWALVLVVLCAGMVALVQSADSSRQESQATLYDLIVCFILAIGLIVAPTLSATSINGDRADATLALLQATALRSQEIVVGKLLAAWASAIAFLTVPLPFLLTFTVMGGSHWQALIWHVVILVFTLGAVCAISLGISSLSARSSASSVLSYLVVVALMIGTPTALALSAPAVGVEQTTITYRTDYDASTNGKVVCLPSPDVYTQQVARTEWTWWMLIPNPFVALGDATIHAPEASAMESADLDHSPLSALGDSVDTMRQPHPDKVVYNSCEENHAHPAHRDMYDRDSDARTTYSSFWPVSLLVLMALGGGGVLTAVRRVRVPAGKLPRGIRLA